MLDERRPGHDLVPGLDVHVLEQALRPQRLERRRGLVERLQPRARLEDRPARLDTGAGDSASQAPSPPRAGARCPAHRQASGSRGRGPARPQDTRDLAERHRPVEPVERVAAEDARPRTNPPAESPPPTPRAPSDSLLLGREAARIDASGSTPITRANRPHERPRQLPGPGAEVEHRRDFVPRASPSGRRPRPATPDGRARSRRRALPKREPELSQSGCSTRGTNSGAYAVGEEEDRRLELGVRSVRERRAAAVGEADQVCRPVRAEHGDAAVEVLEHALPRRERERAHL